jgi:hypothetical protein
MKKFNLMTLALVALTAGVATVQAEEPAKKQEAAVVAKASDEQAFAAKLSAQNKAAFDKFSAEQKKAAMAAKTASADEAVQKVLKDQQAVTTADKAEKAAPAAAAPAKAK